MISDRLSHLQSEVQKYYKQLAGREKAKRMARFEDKELLQQQIDELKEELRSVERDYWECWQAEIAGLTIPEEDAEIVASQLVREVEFLEIEPAVQRNAELMKVLQEIKAELSKPGIPVAGKLKAAIPLLPGLIYYEVEWDTEGLWRRVFPTFCNFADKLKK
jgi:chromosome segregation ATPase